VHCRPVHRGRQAAVTVVEPDHEVAAIDEPLAEARLPCSELTRQPLDEEEGRIGVGAERVVLELDPVVERGSGHGRKCCGDPDGGSIRTGGEVRRLPSARMTIFGVHTGLQHTSADELRGLWRRIEELGFGWISIWDHFYAATLGDDAQCLEAVA